MEKKNLPELNELDVESFKRVFRLFSTVCADIAKEDYTVRLVGHSLFDGNFVIPERDLFIAYKVIYHLTESYDSISIERV